MCSHGKVDKPKNKHNYTTGGTLSLIDCTPLRTKINNASVNFCRLKSDCKKDTSATDLSCSQSPLVFLGRVDTTPNARLTSIFSAFLR